MTLSSIYNLFGSINRAAVSSSETALSPINITKYCKDNSHYLKKYHCHETDQAIKVFERLLDTIQHKERFDDLFDAVFFGLQVVMKAIYMQKYPIPSPEESNIKPFDSLLDKYKIKQINYMLDFINCPGDQLLIIRTGIGVLRGEIEFSEKELHLEGHFFKSWQQLTDRFKKRIQQIKDTPVDMKSDITLEQVQGLAEIQFVEEPSALEYNQSQKQGYWLSCIVL